MYVDGGKVILWRVFTQHPFTRTRPDMSPKITGLSHTVYRTDQSCTYCLCMHVTVQQRFALLKLGVDMTGLVE